MDFDKRIKHPAKFVLEKDKLAIGIIDREYGILCPNCGSIEFSEDEELTKIICSNCEGIIAIRAVVGLGWANEEESDE